MVEYGCGVAGHLRLSYTHDRGVMIDSSKWYSALDEEEGKDKEKRKSQRRAKFLFKNATSTEQQGRASASE